MLVYLLSKSTLLSINILKSIITDLKNDISLKIRIYEYLKNSYRFLSLVLHIELFDCSFISVKLLSTKLSLL